MYLDHKVVIKVVKLVSDCNSEDVKSLVKKQKPSSVLNIVTVNPVEGSELSIVLEVIVFEILSDIDPDRCFISYSAFIINIFITKNYVSESCDIFYAGIFMSE